MCFSYDSIPMFWMKVLPEYSDLAVKALKFAAVSDILLMRVWISCDGSSKDETVKQTGREGHIAGVIIPRW